jgi:hypothetical protein
VICLETKVDIITLWGGLYTQHYNSTTWIVERGKFGCATI